MSARTRVLIAALPEKGHLHPFLGPAAALEERGAEVAFFVPRDVRADLGCAGFERVFVPQGAAPPAPEARGAKFAEALRDPEQLRAWIRALLVAATPALVPAVEQAIAAFRPHAVAFDPMLYAAAIAAARADLPWVGWSTSLNPVIDDSVDSELIGTTRALDAERRALFRAFGLEPEFRVSDVLSPFGTAVFATEDLCGAAPPGVRLVGPSLPRRPRGDAWSAAVDAPAADGPALVYASFGSQAWHQPARFARLFAACAGLEARLLCAAGDLAAQLAPPRNARVVAYADQLAVLRAARVLVTHGGANSVMEALAHGVPMLVSPICNDQFHNAALVEGARAGRVVDLDGAPVPVIRAALEALLADGPERRAAARIQAAWRALDGAAGAADLVLEALQ